MINSNNITYVSNAGVLIKINDKKILIDGLCDSKEPIYKSTTEKIKVQIIDGVSPFDNIDLVLITHQHSDHFDADSIAKLLKQSPNTIIISTQEVIARIISNKPNIDIRNLIALDMKPHSRQTIKVKGIEVLVISMVHDGKEYADIRNLAYLIKSPAIHGAVMDNAATVLHLGDAAPTVENFQALNLHQYKIDILVANFPYVSIPTARKIVKEYIKPKKIVVVHLPYKELDKFGWITAAKKSYERVKDDFIPVEFFEDIGVSTSI